MKLSRTDGVHSRTRTLAPEQVHRIRQEFDRGYRGKDRAKLYGISRYQYDEIGRRKAWSQLPENTEDQTSGQVPGVLS